MCGSGGGDGEAHVYDSDFIRNVSLEMMIVLKAAFGVS